MLRPTSIYVPEVLDIIAQVPAVKALINITGDGLLNLPRVAAKVGFELDNLPSPPPIFQLIQKCGAVDEPEMYGVYNMGVGFCVLAAERDCAAILSILERHGRTGRMIGRVIADDSKSVHLPAIGLIGQGKRSAAMTYGLVPEIAAGQSPTDPTYRSGVKTIAAVALSVIPAFSAFACCPPDFGSP